MTYPLRLYVYEGALANPPVRILDETHLAAGPIVDLIRRNIAAGREIVITDGADLLVFHARAGAVVFPERGMTEYA